MYASAKTSTIRTSGLILWALLPCVAMWVGLYHLESAVWAYGLYHGLCLIPAIIWGRKLWLPTFVKPTARDSAVLVGVSIIFGLGAVAGYELIGSMLLSKAHVPVLLRELGVSNALLVLFAFYTTVVNPLLEELFWRGVVLNELDKVPSPFNGFGIVCSSLLYALFHYLIFRLVLYPGWAEMGIVLLAGYGALMAIIYRKTGSILTTALAHGLLTDLACVLLMLDNFRSCGMP